MCFPIAVYKVRDRSMEPAFHDGDYVIVNRWARRFNVGDVVIAEHPNESMRLLKRVKRKNAGSYFLVGDNITRSTDSRRFGPVRRQDILGKVIIRV